MEVSPRAALKYEKKTEIVLLFEQVFGTVEEGLSVAVGRVPG